jgi:hypothetical protein
MPGSQAGAMPSDHGTSSSGAGTMPSGHGATSKKRSHGMPAMSSGMTSGG